MALIFIPHLSETRSLQAGTGDGQVRVGLPAGLPGLGQTAGGHGGLLLSDLQRLPRGAVDVEGGAAPAARSPAELRGVAQKHVPAASDGPAAGRQHPQAERPAAGAVSLHTCLRDAE